MLYLIATPIGNLGDMTYRAVETLKSCDAVFCEDTRRSTILMSHYEIKKPLFAYHKFNESAETEKILTLLRDGKNVALISDAGMPLISDPGETLVAALIENNLSYTVIPGASASLSALALSGLSAREFCFLGFLPEKKKERDALLDRHKNTAATLIFYVPPHDLRDYLAVLYKHLGARKAAAVREITKIHEETIRFTLGEEYTSEIRGEYCLVVEGANESSADENALNKLSVPEHIKHYMNLGHDKKESVKLTAKDRGVPKNEIYQEAIEKNLDR